jgi:hypothetical protein
MWGCWRWTKFLSPACIFMRYDEISCCNTRDLEHLCIDNWGSRYWGRDRINLAQDLFQWWTLLLAMPNLRVMTFSYAFGTKIKIVSKHNIPSSKVSAVYHKITLIIPSLSLSSYVSIFCNVANSQLVVFTDDWSHCSRPIFKNQDAQEEGGHGPWKWDQHAFQKRR